MAKKVFYDDDARRRILSGAEILYNAVKTTMGPKGRNVVISKSYGHPTVTHDGVTVAKGIDIADVDDETLGYSTGAELIKQAATKMNDSAGDGTTTVTVLTYHILKEANRLIAAGHNPMLLRKGLERAATNVLKSLTGMAEQVEGNKQRIAEVATISANDELIGTLIADVMDAIGKDGVVTVEEGRSLELESEVVEGYTFDRGFVSPYMVTDPKRMEAVYSKPAIIVTDKKVSSAQEFVPLIEKVAQSGKKDLILVADDIDGEALGLLVLNRLKGAFNTVAIKAPSDKETLQDIAVLVGAQVISEERGMTFDNVEADVIGTARKVIVTKDATTIIEGAGDKVQVQTYLDVLASHINAATNDYQKRTLTKRHAGLSGKVAVIKVGGATETEIEEKKFRVDDAVAAVKASLAEGIVPGGGVTLVGLAHQYTVQSKGDESVVAGEKLLIDSLEQPFKILLTNSGLNADEWLPQVRKASVGYGLNVNNPQKLVDLKAAGVVDPVRVTREALSNAVSIAGTAMTMGALIVDVPEAPTAGSDGAGMPNLGMY
ncbi:molecular chaperone GroEL [Candidatus Saccharibacteria bacterium]|nr:molecular chaperone GroEL [Candidatus Saccharibacteria bacterium]